MWLLLLLLLLLLLRLCESNSQLCVALAFCLRKLLLQPLYALPQLLVPHLHV